MMMRHYTQKITKGFIALFLVLAMLLVSYSPALIPPRAASAISTVEVGPVVGMELITSIKTALSAAADFVTSGATQSLVLKEFTLDKIAFLMINIVLHEMSRSVVTWINSGFKGSPAFVTDLEGFLTGVADKAAGNFIWGSELGFLCSPFKLDIRLALSVQYGKTRDFNVQCKLSDVVRNMDGFFKGDFLAGGWDGWFSMTTNPVNNPYGALLLADSQLNMRIGNSKGMELKLTEFGKGFFTMKNCVEDELGQHCWNVTPGTAIEAQLNNTLDSGQRRVQVADEINEIIGALFSQLVSQAFSGAGGLLGLTQSGYGGGSGTYYDQMAAENVQLGYQDTSGNTIPESVEIETRYLGLQQLIVAMIEEAKTYEDDRWNADCYSGDFPAPLLRTQLTAASNSLTAQQTVTTLEDLLTRLVSADSAAATTSATTQNEVWTEYTALQSSGKLHQEVENLQIELETIPDIQKQIDAYTQAVDLSCNIMMTAGG